MYFEDLSKHIVEIHLIIFVNLREGNRASVADLSLRTLALDSSSCISTYLHHLCALPVPENWMASSKVCYPLIGMLYYILIHTVFIVFLLVRIEEEIDAG